MACCPWLSSVQVQMAHILVSCQNCCLSSTDNGLVMDILEFGIIQVTLEKAQGCSDVAISSSSYFRQLRSGFCEVSPRVRTELGCSRTFCPRYSKCEGFPKIFKYANTRQFDCGYHSYKYEEMHCIGRERGRE